MERPIQARQAFSIAPSSSASNLGIRTHTKLLVNPISYKATAHVPQALSTLFPPAAPNDSILLSYTAYRIGITDATFLHPFRHKPEMIVHIELKAHSATSLLASLTAIRMNIAYLQTRTNSKTWGSDSTFKITVLLTGSGVSEGVLDVLGLMGVFQSNIRKRRVGGCKVLYELFEYTTLVEIGEDGVKGSSAMQLVLCIGDGDIGRDIAVMAGAGLYLNASFGILQNTCLYHFWKSFERDPNLGIATSCTRIRRDWRLLNPLVAYQDFVARMSGCLGKPLESVVGCLGSLGDVWCVRVAAYSRKCNDAGVVESIAGKDTLPTEIFLAGKERWTGKYVAAAEVVVGPVVSSKVFVRQASDQFMRHFFTLVYAISSILRISRTRHSIARKASFCVYTLFNAFTLLFTWFAVVNNFLPSFLFKANIYLIYFHLGKSFDITGGIHIGPFSATLFRVIASGFGVISILNLLLSLGKGTSTRVHIVTGVFLGAVTTLMVYIAGGMILGSVDIAGDVVIMGVKFSEDGFRYFVAPVLGCIALYVFTAVISQECVHLVTSGVQYTLLLPSHFFLVMTYASKTIPQAVSDLLVCNLRGEAGKREETAEQVHTSINVNLHETADEQFSRSLERRLAPRVAPVTLAHDEDPESAFRTRVLITWVLTNAVWVMVWSSEVVGGLRLSFGKGSIPVYIVAISYSYFGMTLVRALGTVAFRVTHVVFG